MNFKRTSLCVLWLLLSGTVLVAQSPSDLGRIPFGSYFDADLDSINLYSGNLMLDIPVFSRPGRGGFSAGLRLVYNAQGWKDGSTLYSTYGYYVGGWHVVNPFGPGGSEVYPYLVDCEYPPFPSTDPPTGFWQVSVKWIDTTGAAHFYDEPSIVVTPQDGGCGSFSWNSWNFGGGDWLDSLNQADESRAFLGANGAVKIFFGDGHFIEPWTYHIESTNGNYADIGSNGLLTDTLGRTITTTYGSDTSGENYVLYTLPDANGDPQVYRLDYLDCLSVHNPIEHTTECINNVLKTINLPNGRSYQFQYQHEQGFLTKVILPSGGYIEYDYYGGNTSHNVDENYVVARRVSADGSTAVQWTYSRATSGSDRIITVGYPENQAVTHTFDSSGYETETEWIENYTTTKLVETSRGANGQTAIVTTQMGDVKQRQTYTWWLFRLTESTQSDWYPAGGAAVPLTRTLYSYADGVLSFPSQVELQKWNGSSYETTGKTQFFYDQYSLASTSSVPNHNTPSGNRWNLTTVRKYRDASNYVEEHFHYDDVGNTVEHVDPRSKSTTFSFADNFSDSGNRNSAAYPTLVTNAQGHVTEAVYDYNTGLVVRVLDARGQETDYTYEAMDRPATITEPSGRVTSYTYTDSTPKVEEQVSVASGVVRKAETVFDKLNRPIQVKQYDPDGNVFVDTEYDGNGLAKKVSAPYRSGTPVWTQTFYDVLGRPVTITNPDSTTVTFSYSGNTVTTTDEAGNQRRQTTNGLGQLTKVEEPNSPSGWLETNYSYYVFGPLAQVAQGSQTRSFSSDWLGRISQESHPENGTTSYTYYDDGLVHTRTDARNLVTTYTYDDIGRPLTVTYSDSTPDVTYTYDENSYTGFLTSVDTDGVTASTFQFDAAGNLSGETVSLDGVSGTFTTAYTYDLEGRLLTVTYPSGRVVTRSYASGSGITSDRLSSLSDNPTSASLVGSVVDNAAGQILSRTLGSSIGETRSFNSRLELTGISATTGSTTLMDLAYGYGTTNNTGQIRSRTDAVQPEHTVAYTYDAIGRLTAAASSPSWGLSWVLDRYGNRTSQTPTGLASGRVGSQSLAYNDNKNTSWTYDNAGNVTYDGTSHYYYDAENRLIQIDSSAIQYAYDAEGRRVRKTVGSATTFSFYGLTGLMSEFSTETSLSSATTAASTDRLEYRTSDPTGTAVLLIAPDGTVRSNNRVFPFGEQWQIPTGSSNAQEFTTYQRDDANGEAGLDYAMARYYASRSGRFMTPDPGHVGANVGDPQSWNAFTYGANDPINNIDSNGMSKVPIRGESECWSSLGGTVEKVYMGLEPYKRSDSRQEGGTIIVNVEEGWEERWELYCNYNDGGAIDFAKALVNEYTPHKLVPNYLSNPEGSVLGSAWASGSTSIGMVYGLASIPTEGFGFEHGQIQFKGSLLQGLLGNGRAITLGEVGIYAPGNGPESITDRVSRQTLGLEESYHSRQARILGPYYLLAHFASGVASSLLTGDWHKANPLEQGPHQVPPRRF